MSSAMAVPSDVIKMDRLPVIESSMLWPELLELGDDKRKYMSRQTQPVLEQLRLDVDTLVSLHTKYEKKDKVIIYGWLFRGGYVPMPLFVCVVANLGILIVCVITNLGILIVCVITNLGILIVCVITNLGILIMCVITNLGILIVCVITNLGILMMCVVYRGLPAFKGIGTNNRDCALRFVLWQVALVMFNRAATTSVDSKSHKESLVRAVAAATLAEQLPQHTVDDAYAPPPALYHFIDIVGLLIEMELYAKSVTDARRMDQLFSHLLNMEICVREINRGIAPPAPWSKHLVVIRKWLRRAIGDMLIPKWTAKLPLRDNKQIAAVYVFMYIYIYSFCCTNRGGGLIGIWRLKHCASVRV